jgi:hypothetical protein
MGHHSHRFFDSRRKTNNGRRNRVQFGGFIQFEIVAPKINKENELNKEINLSQSQRMTMTITTSRGVR